MKILLLLQIISTVGIMDFLNPFLAVAAPFVTQFIKKQLKLTGNGAVLVTVVVSVGLALVGAWATGMFVAGASSVAALATVIFTASTLIYKFIVSNDTVQSALPETLKN